MSKPFLRYSFCSRRWTMDYVTFGNKRKRLWRFTYKSVDVHGTLTSRTFCVAATRCTCRVTINTNYMDCSCSVTDPRVHVPGVHRSASGPPVGSDAGRWRHVPGMYHRRRRQWRWLSTACADLRRMCATTVASAVDFGFHIICALLLCVVFDILYQTFALH